MEKQPNPYPLPQPILGVDPQPKRVFDKPTVFTGPQLYSYYVYLLNEGKDFLGRQTVLEQSDDWWLLPNSRARIRMSQYQGPLPKEANKETVSVAWGRYTIEDGFRVQFESDLKEKLTLYLVSGRRTLVWQGSAYSSMFDEDHALLQGTWVAVGGEQDGDKLSEEALQQMKGCTFAGKTFALGSGDDSDRGTFATDWSARPKTINVAFTEGPRKGQKQLGIYELNGDTLKVCWPLDGKTRPTNFTTKPGSNRTLVIWQRQEK
jgi:uncharacterized protein (TIGR03067 family)